jgi:hypothetical protein
VPGIYFVTGINTVSVNELSQHFTLNILGGLTTFRHRPPEPLVIAGVATYEETAGVCNILHHFDVVIGTLQPCLITTQLRYGVYSWWAPGVSRLQSHQLHPTHGKILTLEAAL